MYLSYINMIEKKEKLNKAAPSEEIKSNVMKIYTEVVKLGMLFASPGYKCLRYLPPSVLPESAPTSWEETKFILSRVRRILEEALSRKNGLVAQYIVDRILKLVAKMEQYLWNQPMNLQLMNLDTDAKWIKETFRWSWSLILQNQADETSLYLWIKCCDMNKILFLLNVILS